MKENHGAHEISEAEFDEVCFMRDDAVSLEYDENTGKIREDGYIYLDHEDEQIIGNKFIDSFIDSGKEISWGRNDDTDMNYEIKRWNSKR